MPLKTEAQHDDEIRALYAPIAPKLDALLAEFTDVAARINLAAADGVARGRYPSEVVMPGTFTVAHGINAVRDALARLRKTGWLSS